MNMPVDTFADPIAAHAKEMLAHLGEDPRRAGLRDTPQRFANALRFLTGGYEAEPRDVVGNGVFDAEGEGVVLVRPSWSSPKRATCAWRCAAWRSSTPRPPRAPCAASMRTMRPPARKFFP
jgi:hypothetical protein